MTMDKTWWRCRSPYIRTTRSYRIVIDVVTDGDADPIDVERTVEKAIDTNTNFTAYPVSIQETEDPS